MLAIIPGTDRNMVLGVICEIDEDVVLSVTFLVNNATLLGVIAAVDKDVILGDIFSMNGDVVLDVAFPVDVLDVIFLFGRDVIVDFVLKVVGDILIGDVALSLSLYIDADIGEVFCMFFANDRYVTFGVIFVVARDVVLDVVLKVVGDMVIRLTFRVDCLELLGVIKIVNEDVIPCEMFDAAKLVDSLVVGKEVTISVGTCAIVVMRADGSEFDSRPVAFAFDAKIDSLVVCIDMYICVAAFIVVPKLENSLVVGCEVDVFAITLLLDVKVVYSLVIVGEFSICVAGFVYFETVVEPLVVGDEV